MRRKMRRLVAFVITLSMLGFVMPTSTVTTNAATKKLIVKCAKKTVVAGGKTKITANMAVKYKSSNKKIATVSAKGVVKGVKAGTAKITVTAKKYPSKKKVVKITVTKKKVATTSSKSKTTTTQSKATTTESKSTTAESVVTTTAQVTTTETVVTTTVEPTTEVKSITTEGATTTETKVTTTEAATTTETKITTTEVVTTTETATTTESKTEATTTETTTTEATTTEAKTITGITAKYKADKIVYGQSGNENQLSVNLYGFDIYYLYDDQTTEKLDYKDYKYFTYNLEGCEEKDSVKYANYTISYDPDLDEIANLSTSCSIEIADHGSSVVPYGWSIVVDENDPSNIKEATLIYNIESTNTSAIDISDINVYYLGKSSKNDKYLYLYIYNIDINGEKIPIYYYKTLRF